MLKKSFLTIIFSCFVIISSFSNNPVISKFEKLSAQQLLDTAEYYANNNFNDVALICYSLIINSPVANADFEQQIKVVKAYNKAGIIYLRICDYRSAYEYFIKALILCEKINYLLYESKIYNNIGNIYSHFKKYDLAKQYYSKALNLCSDTTSMVAILSNLGAVEIGNENLDSASYILNKSLQISKQQHDIYRYNILNNIAAIYQKEKCYDSAFYYCQVSLQESRKKGNIEMEAENLSTLGGLFFEINKMDSALFYIELSNTMAIKNNFLKILERNYLILSKIEETRGHTLKAFEYYKKYANLKDSIFNTDNFGYINQLQHLYEITKTNQQIEQLAIERQIKERTIHYQKIIQFITLSVLIIVSIALLIIFFQKRKLDKAYKVLFEKNMKMVSFHISPENHPEKYKKSSLTDELQDELINKILTVMKDSSIICDPEFTLDKLAELVQSNQTYVSQIINTVLNKNFRSFLNEYRILEAQRLFSDPDMAKYTIETVAFQVGFKSRITFYNAFKDITGINPSFYLKSIQEQQ